MYNKHILQNQGRPLVKRNQPHFVEQANLNLPTENAFLSYK